jgi:hypothetical protein
MGAKKKDDEKLDPPSSSLSLAMFMIVLLIYFIMRFILADRHGVRKPMLIIPLTIALVLIAFAMQINTNIYLSRVHCGQAQVGPVVGYTVMSNVMYMVVVVALLTFLPGFKSPFSNTFGYMAIAIRAKQAMNKVIIDEDDNKNSLLKDIYQDKSSFINLLTPTKEGFDDVLEKIAGNGNMLKSDWESNKGELWNLVVIKDYIGQFCWLVLGMALTVSTTFNSILGIENCSNDADYREKLASKANAELNKNKKK